MIKPMRRVQVAVWGADREALLHRLADLGVLHITPVEPDRALPESEIATELDNVRRAVQMLSSIEPSGEVPEISIREAVTEVLEIQRAQAEYESRLTSLYRQLEQQQVWGEVTIDDLEELRSAGVNLLLYKVPKELVSEVKADAVEVLGEEWKEEAVVAVIDKTGKVELPDEAGLVPEPVKDNPAIRAEAGEIDARRRKDADRLGELANRLEEITRFFLELEEKCRFSAAMNSGLEDEELFAIEGWAPAEQYERLLPELEASGVTAAARAFEPSEEETPPTLVGYPKWAIPIKGLFDMLHTLPGYREIDLSVFFMIAMPVFAAMLNGDAGYGLILLLPPVLVYRKVKRKLGKEGTLLLIIFGITTVIWGLLNGNIFGVKPDALASIAPLERGTEEASRNVLIAISFLIGSAHLVVAHLRRILAIFPDTRALAETGWIIVLLGLLGLIWAMFPFFDLPVQSSATFITVAAGMGLVILFSSPYPNPLKRLGVGLASSLLPLISSFGDMMSYIRLVAVGLASYYIAVAFNDLGSMVAGPATWAAAAPILVFGHGLNLILIIIAIFAHGVRLNMLEFSSHCSVEWSGYPYTPFARTKA